MHNIMQLLIDHGYLALFLAVLAEEFGLPVPAAPFLIAAGALAGLDRLNLAWALAIATGASLISDYTWFHLGQSEGSLILKWLGRRSPEPQSRALKIQSTYLQYGPRSILISKFVPVFNFVAPQLAGTFRLAPWKFFALDSAAVLLWASAYMAIGWVFRGQLELVGPLLQHVGVFVGVVLTIAAAGFILRRISGASLRHVAAR
jgi:membrane protein DedA with SNARE-associated domain